MNEDPPGKIGTESGVSSFSRQRLRGFEIHHAYQITTELGRLTRAVEKQQFRPEQAANSRTDSTGRRAVGITFDVPMLRVNRVGDALNRDWVIFSDGRIYTCYSFVLSPDVLDISTLTHPEPKDIIKDQDRILDHIQNQSLPKEQPKTKPHTNKPSSSLEEYRVPLEVEGIVARYRSTKHLPK